MPSFEWFQSSFKVALQIEQVDCSSSRRHLGPQSQGESASPFRKPSLVAQFQILDQTIDQIIPESSERWRLDFLLAQPVDLNRFRFRFPSDRSDQCC